MKMEKPPATSDGGILIPEKSRDTAIFARVVRTGIWRMNKRGNLIPFPVKSGDRVVVSKHAGRWLHGERNGWKLVPMERILAVFE